MARDPDGGAFYSGQKKTGAVTHSESTTLRHLLISIGASAFLSGAALLILAAQPHTTRAHVRVRRGNDLEDAAQILILALLIFTSVPPLDAARPVSATVLLTAVSARLLAEIQSDATAAAAQTGVVMLAALVLFLSALAHY